MPIAALYRGAEPSATTSPTTISPGTTAKGSRAPATSRTSFDLPRASLLYAKGAPNGVLTFAFETWLVCVIGDTIIDNNVAKDDKYTVAPLIGWVWGFDITYKDVGEIGVDELVDFTVKKRDFAFGTTPSAAWTQALGAKYGAGDKRDKMDDGPAYLSSQTSCIRPQL